MSLQHTKAIRRRIRSLEMPNDNIDGYAVANGVNYLTSFSHLCGKEPGAVFELCFVPVLIILFSFTETTTCCTKLSIQFKR